MNIKETIQLLGIQDVTTKRQKKNGTITWKLPIKRWGKFIEVASFKSGYVRNNNCGYSNYQLNKCKMSKRYYQYANGKIHEFDTKERILIPREQDRLDKQIKYKMGLFRKKLGQNEKLIRNINRLNEKEKTKQQESKVLGQKLIKETKNKEKSTRV
jgi:hypothetical protein